MTDDENLFIGFLFLVFVFASSWVAYNVGRQSTISEVIKIIDQEEQVTKETVILDDLKLDISKLR